MGIHLAIDNPTLDAHHPQEIREMRVRLYWSGECCEQSKLHAIASCQPAASQQPAERSVPEEAHHRHS